MGQKGTRCSVFLFCFYLGGVWSVVMLTADVNLSVDLPHHTPARGSNPLSSFKCTGWAWHCDNFSWKYIFIIVMFGESARALQESCWIQFWQLQEEKRVQIVPRIEDFLAQCCCCLPSPEYISNLPSAVLNVYFNWVLVWKEDQAHYIFQKLKNSHLSKPSLFPSSVNSLTFCTDPWCPDLCLTFCTDPWYSGHQLRFTPCFSFFP